MAEMTPEDMARSFTEQYMHETTGSRFGDPGLRRAFSWPFQERMAEAIRAAVQAEREACAKVAETHVTLAPLKDLPMDSHQAARWLRSSIAAAIRARGKGEG